MVVNNIEFSSKFLKKLQKLSQEIIILAEHKIELFRKNPLHPSLRLHELHGELKDLWSISINNNYRLIFRRQANGDILFFSIGKHDLYKNL